MELWLQIKRMCDGWKACFIEIRRRRVHSSSRSYPVYRYLGLIQGNLEGVVSDDYLSCLYFYVQLLLYETYYFLVILSSKHINELACVRDDDITFQQLGLRRVQTGILYI
jgi:hypothetical protein